MTRKDYIEQDPYFFPAFLSKAFFVDSFLKSEQYYIRRYVSFLRKEEFYTFHAPNKLLRYYYQRRKNLLGVKLGFFIPAGCFESGLKIYHYGSIIVNRRLGLVKIVRYMGIAASGAREHSRMIRPVLAIRWILGKALKFLGE